MQPQTELRIHARPHPLMDQRVDLKIPAGLTIAEIFERVQPNAIMRRGASIYIDDWYIPENLWHRVRPREGRFVQIAAALPQDIGGGGGKKSPLRMVLMLAVVAASFYLPGAILATPGATLFGSLTMGQALGAAISLPGIPIVNLREAPRAP